MKRVRVETPAGESGAGGAVSQSKISRRVKACQQCQTRKIKCDISKDQPRCTRCARMGLECHVKKSLQTLLDDENEWKYDVEEQLRALRAAMAQVQSILQIPEMVLIDPGGSEASRVQCERESSPVIRKPLDSTYTTRETSPESVDAAQPREDQAIVDAPMASLFEVTKLKNIHSNRSPSAAGLSGQDQSPDFISQGKVDLSEAERLFSKFKTTLNAYLWGGIALVHDTLASARQSSELLAAAIVTVTALHTQDGGNSFDRYYSIFTELVGQSVFQRHHSLDDIRGLCIGAFWLSDISWKLSGLAVRIATELNLHQYCARALRNEPEHIEKARLWYILYVCDHHFSIAYGRPPVIPEDITIARHESFLDLPGVGPADHRLHSQVSVFVILSRAYHTFGPDRSKLVANDEFEALRRYDADLIHWRSTWAPRLAPDPHISHYPSKGVILHYDFARLQLVSVCLRGLKPADQNLISPDRRYFIEVAIESASSALRLIVDDADMRSAIIGVPLYLLTTVAYAAIFLMKVQSDWKAADFNITYDGVYSLLEKTVALLKESRGYARHVAYYLGKGLGRMLDKFKAREAAYQRQMAQQGQRSLEQADFTGDWNQMGSDWGDWLLSGSDVMSQYGLESLDYYPLGQLDVLGSQMPGWP